MSRDDTKRFIDEYEQDVDEIIAACRGDLRGAVKALMLVNEQLEQTLQRLSGCWLKKPRISRAAVTLIGSQSKVGFELPLYRSPGHHVEGGSLAEILVRLSATRWLRL